MFRLKSQKSPVSRLFLGERAGPFEGDPESTLIQFHDQFSGRHLMCSLQIYIYIYTIP